MSVSKRDRDAAMQLILDHNRERSPGHMIGPAYLDHIGLPDGASGVDVVEVLHAMEFIEYEKSRSGDIYSITPTNLGIHYFETDADERQKRDEIFRHEWKVAAFSALAGALASEPLWYCIKYLWSMIHH